MMSAGAGREGRLMALETFVEMASVMRARVGGADEMAQSIRRSYSVINPAPPTAEISHLGPTVRPTQWPVIGRKGTRANKKYGQPNLERLAHGCTASFRTCGREQRHFSKSESWEKITHT